MKKYNFLDIIPLQFNLQHRKLLNRNSGDKFCKNEFLNSKILIKDILKLYINYQNFYTKSTLFYNIVIKSKILIKNI